MMPGANGGRRLSHNGWVTTAQISHPGAVSGIRRPNTLAVGTIVWLGSEVMFFAGLFAIYFTLRSLNPELWAERTQLLNLPFALTNTSILVISSFTAQFGVFAAHRRQAYRTSWNPFANKGRGWGMTEWFILSFILGAIFVSGQIFEYAQLVSEGVSFNTDAYAAAFYLTTGFHGLHVTGGLIAFLFIIGRAYAAKKFGAFEESSTLVVSYYWHFVDVVWIFLFAVIYFLQ